jgi:glycosyltransferase involved in cell wall biosynthesis
MRLLKNLPAPPEGKKGWPWTEEVDPSIYRKDILWPKISIVTPSYNQGVYIEETIRSVLLQNYPNIEFIIIDGGSADESVEIIKKYDSWLKFWVSEPDKGQTHAINKGFKMVTGEVTNWLNSDDYYVKGALQKIGIATYRKPEIDFFHGSGFYIRDGKIWSAKKHFDHMGARCFVHFCYDLQPSCFYRTRVFEEIGFLDEDMFLQMDTEFFIRIALNFRMERLNEDITFFRQHEKRKSFSGYKQKKHQEFPNEHHKIFSRVLKTFNDKILIQIVEETGYFYDKTEKFINKNEIPYSIKKKSVILYLLNLADLNYKKRNIEKGNELVAKLLQEFNIFYLFKFRVFRSLFIKKRLKKYFFSVRVSN